MLRGLVQLPLPRGLNWVIVGAEANCSLKNSTRRREGIGTTETRD